MEKMERERFTSIEKKQLIIFFIIAFGFTYLMGLPMAEAAKRSFPVDLFVNTQMMYPAVGAIIAMLITKWNDPRLPKKFYISIVFFTVLMVLVTVLSLFTDMVSLSSYPTILMGGGVISWFIYFIEKKQNRISYSLTTFKKNKGYIYILLFLVLYFARIYVPVLLGLEELENVIPSRDRLMLPLILLPNFILVMLPFFGEEYGWRGFLQPLLQKRFGNIIGIFILGFLWGIWHLPVNILFYSPQTWGYSVLNQIIVCTGYSVFFGYAYMKTNNIWIPVWIHYLNNNLIALFVDPSAIQNQVLNMEAIIFMFISTLILYMPFILAPTFKKVKLEPIPIQVPKEFVVEEVSEENIEG